MKAANTSKPPSGSSQWQSAAYTVAKPKMDVSKALAILGFSSSRSLNPCSGNDPKVELNAALSRRMEDIERKKLAAMKPPMGFGRAARALQKAEHQEDDKSRDEVRILHEAYQFLSKKYSIRPEDAVSPTASASADSEDNRREEPNNDQGNDDGLPEHQDLQSEESEHEDLTE